MNKNPLETRIKLNRTSLTSIPSRGYNVEYSTTGSSNSSTLIYIKCHNINEERISRFIKVRH